MAAILCALDPSGAGIMTGRAFCSRLRAAAVAANQLSEDLTQTGLPPMKDYYQTPGKLPSWSGSLQKEDSAFQAHESKVQGAVQGLERCAASNAFRAKASLSATCCPDAWTGEH